MTDKASPDSGQPRSDASGARGGIVGLGASAGGVEALSAFFDGLPDDTGLAFVVILHLMPDHESYLAHLLQEHTAMPVMEVKETTRVEPDHVYIISPGTSLDLVDGALQVARFDNPAASRSSIDRFFRSLAAVSGREAIGVVLSGTGSDGTLGLKDIKEAGGLVMVQDPADASQDGMPRSALATGIVDVVLPARELGARVEAVHELAADANVPVDPAQLVESDAKVLEAILTHLAVKTGNDFRHYKRSTVLRRIARRMQVRGVSAFAAYLQILREMPDEPGALLRDLLITVTRFFRDPDAFQALEETVIPKLFEGKKEADEIRVWVAGCATGEEAYSIAMLLLEHAERLGIAPRLQVFATDISEQAIVSARKGLYPDAIKEDVGPERLERFFTHEANSYRVKKSLRNVVLFAVHDLLSAPPFIRLDLISCRNLLIYLNREIQERVFELFHYALRPRGYLFLGTSETPTGSADRFGVVDKDQHIFQRGVLSSARPHLPDLPLQSMRGAKVDSAASASEEHHTLEPGELHQKLVELYAPPSILVDRKYDVVHLSERAGQFLRPPGGEPTKNILQMVPASMQVELRTALYRAFRDGGEGEPKLVRIDEEEPQYVRLNVRRADARHLPADYALVVFERVEATGVRSEGQEIPDEWPDDAAAVFKELEDELRSTKEELRSTVEQYETSNEELKSSNEELQSINEELKSTTEELETSKEELQSTNEELITVNEEHKAKIEELARVNSDLENLMEATQIATIFLDKQFRIEWFTPPIEKIFNITSSDLGRPLAHFTHHLGYDQLLDDAKTVLQDLSMLEREIGADRAEGQKWYLMRIRAYRTAEDAINGVVITFVEITTQKQTERYLTESQQRLEAIVTNALDAILVADDEAHYVDCNPAAIQLLGYTREELLQMRVADLVAGLDEDAFTSIWTAFLEAGVLEGEIELRSKDGSAISAEYRSVTDILPGLHLSVLRDVTERREREQILERQAKIIDEVHDSVIITDLDGVVLTVNRGGQEMVGYTEEELVGHHVSMVYTEEERERVQDEVIAPLKEKGTHETEVRIQRKSGEIRHAHLSLAMLHDAQGHPSGMVGYAVDITERKEMEEDLATANRRISRILRSIAEGFFVVDTDDRLTYVNDRALDLWQMSREELIGRVVWEVLPDTINERFRIEYIKAVQQQGSTSFEAFFAPLGKWFSTDLHPFEKGVSVYFRDVTERRRLQQEVLRIQEEEQRRIGRDLHDGLASLLTGLAMLGRGIANRIERGDPVDMETVEELIRQARGGAEQARYLAHGLNPVKLEEQGLEAALRELCSTVQVLSNVSCSCIVGDDLPDLSGVENHLYRIAQEAALNAVRHAQGTRVELRLRSDDGDVVLTVHDDGIGIDPEAAKNGGMGLHTMRYRAHLIGATLSVKPAPEGGTDIVCRLPNAYISTLNHSAETDVE